MSYVAKHCLDSYSPYYIAAFLISKFEVDAMLERQQRDILAPKTPKSTTPAPATTTPGDVNGIGRLADPTKIEDVVDEDNAYAVFVGNFYETDIGDDEM